MSEEESEYSYNSEDGSDEPMGTEEECKGDIVMDAQGPTSSAAAPLTTSSVRIVSMADVANYMRGVRPVCTPLG